MNEGYSVVHIAIDFLLLLEKLFFFPHKLKTQCSEIAAHSQLFENKILQLQELSKLFGLSHEGEWFCRYFVGHSNYVTLGVFQCEIFIFSQKQVETCKYSIHPSFVCQSIFWVIC